MHFDKLNSNLINSSTLLGLGQCYTIYPRVSHGAIVINAFQAFSYPPKGGLTKIATGATRGRSKKCLMNPDVGSTTRLHIHEIPVKSLSKKPTSNTINIINK